MNTRTTSVLCSLLLGTALFVPACKHDGEKAAADAVTNPASASGTVSAANAPVFTFTEEQHDFGKITQGEKVSYVFKFTNTGKSDLLISNATGSCGCTVPEYPKQPVAPGADGEINVIFNSEGKSGKINKTVTIISNTVPNTKVLTITGEVIVPENKQTK